MVTSNSGILQSRYVDETRGAMLNMMSKRSKLVCCLKTAVTAEGHKELHCLVLRNLTSCQAINTDVVASWPSQLQVSV